MHPTPATDPLQFMSNLAKRILTALVGVPVLLGSAYLGGWVFAALMLAIALIGQQEVYNLLARAGVNCFRFSGLVIGACLSMQALVPSMSAIAYAVIVLLVAFTPFVATEQPLQRLSGTLLGAFYPTVLLMMLVDLRVARTPTVGDLDAFYLVLALFIFIWVTDTSAYFVGKGIGRNKLAPSISPKKTWEGSIGGALGAVLVAVVLKLTILGFLPWLHLLVLAFICGVVSQLGDLAQSTMKRAVDVKDSGNILPGHGGILDRFDSMILAAPLFFLYLRWVADVL